MQITRVEDVVREEREPEQDLTPVSEYSLFEFLENEPDLYTISDLNLRYK